jgi:hypothetical protein
MCTCWRRERGRGLFGLDLFAASPAADKSLMVSGSVGPSVTTFRADSFVASSVSLDMMNICLTRDASLAGRMVGEL